MTKLNGGVPLNSRQLTLLLSPATLTLLGDLARYMSKSPHDAAADLLTQAVQMAHDDLKRMKFVYLLANWIAWGNGPPSNITVPR